MRFTKMHGAGNDYVYVDGFRETVRRPEALAQAVSHRHYGVGGDGLILINPVQDGDAEMVMFNADGSKSEMCGNGLRCVAKFVHDAYARGRDSLRLLTGAGWKTATIVERDAAGAATRVAIDMGAPIWPGLEIPTTLDVPEALNQTLEAGGRSFTFHAVSMGNPHCVIFVDDPDAFPVAEFGPLIEHHPLFPRRVNVEFVRLKSRSEGRQRTWERGSGETWACGTGAAAVAAVCRRLGLTGDALDLHLTGGDLRLEYTGSGSVTLIGGAVEVFRGDFPWE